jgi:methylenetetrahydrofolate reductase (NADPH)
MILDSEKFVVTAEIEPPKGTDVTGLLASANALKGKVGAVLIPDNARGVMRMSPLVVCKLVKDEGVEVIMTVACRDRNRLALQSDLLGAAALGINSILCVTGDHTMHGDHKEAKPVFDVDSVQLLQMAATLNSGKDMNGNELSGAPEFFLASTVNPFASPVELQTIKFEKKVEAGARVFFTQPLFDLERFAGFMEHARKYPVKVLPEICILTSTDVARYQDHKLPGFFIPEDIFRRIREAGENDLNEGISIAAELIKEIKSSKLADGVHLMPGREKGAILEVLERAGA